MDTAMHLLNLELDEDMRSGSVGGTERKDTESVVHGEPINKNRSEMEEKEERIKKIKRLVQEFAAGDAPSAEWSIKGGGGDMGVPERWFTQLGVPWVPQSPAR